MAIYGNLIQERNSFDFDKFIDFVQESDNCVDKLFESFILNEENDLSVIKNDENSFNNSDSVEQVKKTVMQKIKEIIANFAKAVKTLFNKLKDSIMEAYRNTNLKDDFVSKFSKNVTYDNMVLAVKNGWSGFGKNTVFANRLMNFSDSIFQESLNELDYDNISQNIIKAEDLEKAKEAYSEFLKKLENFNNSSTRDSASSMETRNNFSLDVENYFTVRFTNSNIPDQKRFLVMKQLAEHGESNIKQLPRIANELLNNMKVEKEVSKDSIKSFSSGSNKTDNKDINQINILYHKSKYKYCSAYIKRASYIAQQIAQYTKTQYNYSFNNYMKLVMAIKRYVKPQAATA